MGCVQHCPHAFLLLADLLSAQVSDGLHLTSQLRTCDCMGTLSSRCPTIDVSPGPTRHFSPVHLHLLHRDLQLLGQVDQLHVEAPALQPLVADHHLGRAACQQLQSVQ